MNLKRYRIFLADDHPFILFALKQLVMAEADFELIGEATTGLQALSLVRSKMPDVAVVDVILPDGMNGREIATALLARHGKFPVLFTTGYTRNAIVHEGRLDGDVNLIQKPYTQRELAIKICTVLDAFGRN